MKNEPEDFKAFLANLQLEAKQCAELRLKAEALLLAVRRWSTAKYL